MSGSRSFEVRPEENFNAIFVIGCHRTGTTLIGNYLGSSRDVVYVGELGAIFFTSYIVPSEYKRVPSPYKQQYLSGLCEHAYGFMRGIASARGASYICESNPWNVRVLASLQRWFPRAVYVVCLRHYSGTIQSLRRAWADTYTWAGEDDVASAKRWADSYEAILDAQLQRVIPLSYDALCSKPAETLRQFKVRLTEFGLPTDLSLHQLAISHATTTPRSTLAMVENGEVRLVPVNSFDAEAWSKGPRDAISAVVRNTERRLQARFPADYYIPEGFPSWHDSGDGQGHRNVAVFDEHARSGREPYPDEKIIRILKEHESGVPVAELCRRHGVSQQAIYRWKFGEDLSEQ